jgi:hypothetical protein
MSIQCLRRSTFGNRHDPKVYLFRRVEARSLGCVLSLDAPDVLWIEIQPRHFQSLISSKASAYIGQGDHERHRFNRRQLKSEREVKRLGGIRDCMHDNATDADRIGGM